MTEHRYIEPLDIVHFRGNRLFGEAGSLSTTMALPLPSVMAGALRSAILAADEVDLQAFAEGRVTHPALGTPGMPGSFALTALTLARRLSDGQHESLHPWPADLVTAEGAGVAGLRYTKPMMLDTELLHSGPLAQLPVLAEGAERAKPNRAQWLTAEGWQRYLTHETVDSTRHVITEDALWKRESRIGIGLRAQTRSADDGKLFTSDALSFRPGIGFCVAVTGAVPPRTGTLRLGGDGRGAGIAVWAGVALPSAPLAAIVSAGRCRIVLTSPGIFADGWRLPTDKEGRFSVAEVRGRVVAAQVARSQVVSGWDLAKWQPKPAERVAPTGSVYWLDELDGSEEALSALQAQGLWPDGQVDASRRAEGFNRFTFASF